MERSWMSLTNGMPAKSLSVAAWRKSRHSNPHGDCVELGQLEGGKIAVRNSRHPGGPTLIFARAEMAAFIHGVAENGHQSFLPTPLK
jgi:G:T-mismatch repair DNA endonuclease (very short patch repair protein)